MAEQPDQPLREAAWAQLLAAPTPSSFGLLGDGDPLIARLQGDRLLFRPGIYHRSTAELLQRAKATDDPELALGYTLLTPDEGKYLRLRALAERFPESPSVRLIQLGYALKFEPDPVKILTLIERCRRLSPENRFVLLLEIGYLGRELELLPEALQHDELDWCLYEYPPLSDAQLALIQRFQDLREYQSIEMCANAAVRDALTKMNHAFRPDGNEFIHGVTDFTSTRLVAKQSLLSAHIGVARGDYDRVSMLSRFLEAWSASILSSQPRTMIRQMMARMLGNSARDIRDAWCQRQGKATTPEGDDPLIDMARRSADLIEKQRMLYAVPIPSINAIIDERETPMQAYQRDYDAFLAKQKPDKQGRAD